MKRLMVTVLAIVLVFGLAACNNKSVSPDVPAFSYEEEKATYEGEIPGVKHNGFNNTSSLSVHTAEDAIERAKNECTVEWNTTDVYYDVESGVWKVNFYRVDPEYILLGGDQSVYLSDDGKTLLIVYGE